jgi:hypothetical protein
MAVETGHTKGVEPVSAAASAGAEPPSGRGRRCADYCALAALLVCILLVHGHGHGLGLGFWFDDHTHLELCRENGYRGLSSGNAFDWTGRIARVWWAQKATGWAYFRPVTVALRVTWLRLFGLNPLPFHAVHLALYGLAAALFYGVIRRCGGGPRMALTAGVLFTIHPTDTFGAPWLANDGPVLVGL